MLKILSPFMLQDKGIANMFHWEDYSNLQYFYDYTLVKINRIFKAKIHKYGVKYNITFTELSFYEYFMSNYYFTMVYSI